MTQANPRTYRAVHLMTGGSILAAGVLFASRVDLVPYGETLRPVFVALAVIVFLFGALAEFEHARRVAPRLCLALFGLLAGTAALEVAGRLFGLDFAGAEKAFDRLPPFYRQPTIPTGTVFFRRPGPESWTGQVIRTFLEQLRWPSEPYRDEPVVTVHYDHFGLRNEEYGVDWEIAVAGDSFTELGYLPYDQLFTTVLGRLVGASVLNLGVSYTGQLNQLHLLEQYGIGQATRHVVIVFAEANDLEDLERETAAVRRYETTGRRDFRNITPQTSFIRTLCDRLLGPDPPPVPSGPPVDALFKAEGRSLPVTLAHAPPGRAKLPPDVVSALEAFLTDYAKLSQQHKVCAWLAYMPVKERVHYGQLEILDIAAEPIRNWKPTDLPQFIADLCAAHGIRFIDLTPALVEEARASRDLLYNGLYDSHLNARGSVTVARELARQIGLGRSPDRIGEFPLDTGRTATTSGRGPRISAKQQSDGDPAIAHFDNPNRAEVGHSSVRCKQNGATTSIVLAK